MADRRPNYRAPRHTTAPFDDTFAHGVDLPHPFDHPHEPVVGTRGGVGGPGCCRGDIGGGFRFCSLGEYLLAVQVLQGVPSPGLERADYARDRIYDTARHVKDYAREYGGYLQTKLKDVAPGA
ncbi:hypothetical protein MLD38_005301 [Melastoma candidum]|uniref:Uncharacterized protein n=1 Tax=Melastoma candidum TaxID=119954 RepID=A0ACB9S9Z7_9MYRT|nr:hypothetical protein MLD38_005301 [Melastoma candidum]